LQVVDQVCDESDEDEEDEDDEEDDDVALHGCEGVSGVVVVEVESSRYGCNVVYKDFWEVLV
jgi:hypothetical protein